MAWFKINGQKLTAIADAIRLGTGRYDEKVGLDAMPQAIRDGIADAEIRGYYEGIPNAIRTVREVHKITIAEDNAGDANTATWWLKDNQFVIDHYADEGFMLQLISLQAYAEGYAVCYAYNGNRQMAALGENLVCGYRMSRTTNNTLTTATTTGNCYTGNYAGVPYVKTDGSVVSIHKTGGTALLAGDYLLILSVAEV